MNLHEEAVLIVQQLTLEEKCKFCCGKDFWHLYGAEHLNIPSIMLCDGPHGLRKENSQLNLIFTNRVVKSTCFPTSSALACSFDEDLMKKMGKALGEECRKEDVAVILSPGINIKRTPLCGRNFEYFSEDPYLSGKLGAALIKGIQSKGVGACVKHFAANNQEKYRMTTNSIIDERALREIYLKGFEILIKESHPWTVMTSYNRLNGDYCSQNKKLIIDILQKEWGYQGAVISDWGAVNDCVESHKNGLDVEMPGYDDDYYKILEKAVRNKELSEKILDESVTRIIELILKYKEGKKIPYKCNIQEHINLAQEIAENCAVLLKNEDNILPGNKTQNIGVIGKLAKEPVYQGLGSSAVNPVTTDNAYDIFINRNCKISFAKGYHLEVDEINEELLNEAREVANNKDIVYLFIGLPTYYEAEGYDRKNLKLPESHNRLVEEISKINENLVVILQCGSPVEMTWSGLPKAILLTHLNGCRGGNATVNLLLGEKNPCGKLAETFPINHSDCLSNKYYPGDKNNLEYRESIFVGYRYFDSSEKEVKYPFGYGLSYTEFQYSNMKVAYGSNNTIKVDISVTNIGDRVGKEVVQLYISSLDSKLFRAKQELKKFKKITLNPGERKEINFILDKDCFTYYNTETHDWQIEKGKYSINIGSSSRNIKFSTIINKRGDNAPILNYKEKAPSYYELYSRDVKIDDEEYDYIYGKNLPLRINQIWPFTINSTINDMKRTYGGDIIISAINKKAYKFAQGNKLMEINIEESLNDMPFRLITMATQGAISRKTILGFVELLNKHYVKGIMKILRESRQK